MADKDLPPNLEKRIKAFQGDLTKLERAIGIYVLGKRMGYRPMLLIHDKRTLKECETILDVNLHEEWDDVGDLAHKSLAWIAVQKVSNFWKAVKGEIPGIRSTAGTKI